MKLEKLIATLDKAIKEGVPLDSEIRRIETTNIDRNVEAVYIFTSKENKDWQISITWQTNP